MMIYVGPGLVKRFPRNTIGIKKNTLVFRKNTVIHHRISRRNYLEKKKQNKFLFTNLCK